MLFIKNVNDLGFVNHDVRMKNDTHCNGTYHAKDQTHIKKDHYSNGKQTQLNAQRRNNTNDQCTLEVEL